MQMGISESYAMFLGMMEQLDTQVGRILECVENNELSENTIIIFFGDNGPTPTTRILKEENGYYSLTPNFYTMTEEDGSKEILLDYVQKKQQLGKMQFAIDCLFIVLKSLHQKL